MEGWKKVASLTKEQIDEYRLLDNHIGCAKNALRPSALDAEATQEQIDRFILAQNRALASYQFLMDDWWNARLKEAGLERGVHLHIDFEGMALVAPEG